MAFLGNAHTMETPKPPDDDAHPTRFSRLSAMPRSLHRVVGTSQIALMFGVTRGRVAQLITKATFPEAFARLGKAKLWLADDVMAWAESTGRDCHDLGDNYLGNVPEYPDGHGTRTGSTSK